MEKKKLRFMQNNKFIAFMIILIIIILIIGVYLSNLYQDVWNDKTKNYEDMKMMAMDYEEVKQVHNVERYHGDKLYYVLQATSTDDKEIILYMYQKEDKWKHDTYNSENFYSEPVILEEWQNRCGNCDYLGSTIGIDNNYPVLEIKYINKEDKLVYEHVLLEDKSYYRLTLDPAF